MGRTTRGVPLTVAFTDLSQGAPTRWTWNLGDGATSTLENPTHTYTTPGSYTVSLTVEDAGGNVKTAAVANYGTVQPLAAGFTAPPSYSSREGVEAPQLVLR